MLTGPTSGRRPSLERQTTLYDDPYGTYEEKYYDAESYPIPDRYIFDTITQFCSRGQAFNVFKNIYNIYLFFQRCMMIFMEYKKKSTVLRRKKNPT